MQTKPEGRSPLFAGSVLIPHLADIATRREFWSCPNHHICFVYLPKHCSWLNQIETVFGAINRKVIRRGT